LAEAGYSIALDDYEAYTWDRSRGGWKAFNFLRDQGLCQDVRGYFHELFKEIPHPQPDFPPPEEVIAAVRGAGGVVLLAHPGVTLGNGMQTRSLDYLVEMGLDGIECYSSYHDEALTRAYLDYCRRRNLLISGGSDCHGGFVNRSLGVPPISVDDLRLGVLEERVIA
jgi:hypothetical protein